LPHRPRSTSSARWGCCCAVRAGAQIGDLAETIGITAEQVQVFNRLAVASGSSSESMAKGLQSIAEQSVDAESKLSKLFAANGITSPGHGGQ
jgi:hypothetical protein